MRITFLGGAKTVTGSCYLIETDTKKVMVDCGMFQGHIQEYELNAAPFDINPGDVDFILVTHAHIDHTGRIPKLCKEGFRGRVIATKPTVDLCAIMLPDAGHIQEVENEWINRKRERAGKHPIEPIYTSQDAIDSLQYFEGVNYNQTVNLAHNIAIRFNDAGHMLGSSIIEIWINEEGKETKLVFSGDLGNKNLPLLRDPSLISDADYLFIESTYGDRLHKDSEDKVERFINIINETIEKGGNVIIPSFAVGRTQEIIYELHMDKDKYKKQLEKFFKIPVYIDSPLAVNATEVFRRNIDCFDDEVKEYIKNGDNPLDFPGLKFTQSVEESKELNEKQENMIIVSASGMCEAGRIKHHLKHNIWRPECTILFVGYQAPGTLGRRIVDGAQKIKIYGEEIGVSARVEMIDGFSGHADQKGLLDWLGGFKKVPSKIFVVHGEENGQIEFAKIIRERYNAEVVIPDKGEIYTLEEGRISKKADIPEAKYRYARLAVLIEIDDLRHEFNDLLKAYRKALKDDSREDYEIDEVRVRLEQLKEYISNLIR